MIVTSEIFKKSMSALKKSKFPQVSKMVAVDSLLVRTREELGATTHQLAEKEGAKISNVLQLDSKIVHLRLHKLN